MSSGQVARRRRAALVVALVLFMLCLVLAGRLPVGYTIFSPGPTVNVLGKSTGKPIVEITGHRSYPDTGGLRLVTIIPTGPQDQVSLAHAVLAWADPDDDVYPTRAVYPTAISDAGEQQQDAEEMASSQDDAIAAALRALHIAYHPVVKVAAIEPKSPAAGKLHGGDVIQTVNGRRTTTPNEVVGAVRDLPPGTTVHVTVKRGPKTLTAAVTTEALGTKGKTAKQSRVGVEVAETYQFPFHIALHLNSNIGGPSAGLMFSLGVYDELTPGSLTKGHVIAGTGEIDSTGHVGEIGGIRQKIVGAQRDGAQLFLVPAGNCAEAVTAHYDHSKTRLVKVKTMEGALSAIREWTADTRADLPRC